MEPIIPDPSEQRDTFITSIRVPRELWETVKIEAVRRRTSALQICIDALREFLNQPSS